MAKSKTNPKVDVYIGKAKRWQAEMEKLRSILLDCGLEEEIKWGKPCYTAEGGNIVIMQDFKEYFALLFFKGILLKDPENILVKTGVNTHQGRQLRFSSVQEISKIKTTLKAYIKEAIEAEKAGLEIEPRKKQALKVPEELQNKMNEKPALKKAFEALTPGRQRAYIFHFSAPKQAKTREARVEKAMKGILEGKGLNE